MTQPANIAIDRYEASELSNSQLMSLLEDMADIRDRSTVTVETPFGPWVTLTTNHELIAKQIPTYILPDGCHSVQIESSQPTSKSFDFSDEFSMLGNSAFISNRVEHKLKPIEISLRSTFYDDLLEAFDLTNRQHGQSDFMGYKGERWFDCISKAVMMCRKASPKFGVRSHFYGYVSQNYLNNSLYIHMIVPDMWRRYFCEKLPQAEPRSGEKFCPIYEIAGAEAIVTQ